MSSVYDSKVDPLRPNDAHGIALQLIGKGKKVLELGAASGHVTRALKQSENEVTAIERDGRFLEVLESIADQTHITDLDWLDLRDLLNGQTFDVILAGDVLEHCSRPDLVLLQCHSLLRPEGYVVLSIPNIAHADVRLSLLAGRFDYRPTGLLDHTHLRFFTRATLTKFVTECGFKLEASFASTAPLGGTELGPPDASIPKEAIDYVQQDRDSTVYQYVVQISPVTNASKVVQAVSAAQPSHKLLAELSLSTEALAFVRSQLVGQIENTSHLPEELSQTQQELSQTQQELSQTQQELSQTQQELSQTQQELAASEADLGKLRIENNTLKLKLRDSEMSLLHARDAVIGGSAELGTMRAQYEATRSEVSSLVHQLNLLHGSRTWRIGRFVLLPLRGVRRLLKKLAG